MRLPFKLLCTLLIFSFSILYGQSTFYKNYLKTTDDREVFNITATSDGGYAMIGIADTENASSEVAVTKLSCTGTIDWAKKYGISGTIGNVFGTVIEADNGDLVFAYSVGSYQNYDVLLTRVNVQDGSIIWSKRLGGNRDDQARDLVQTIDGNFVLIGGTSSYGTGTSGSAAFTDVYLVKVDGNGNILWTKTFGEAGQIDAGYAIREDSDGNLVMTGRYLVGGTFYAYLMKTTEDGIPIFFKGFGQPNHRTYGYDLEITPDNQYVITGSTTIDKDDFTSYPDVFLIKADESGDTLFTKIYHPWVGNDRSESGSSIVLQEDGGYGIGVPTLSFTTHSVGFVPNKNAIFSTSDDGTLQKALLYNQGGSHYTRLRNGLNDGYIVSNFSNFFSPTFEFLPLVVRAQDDYSCGCNEIDVTGEVNTVVHPWDVQDIGNYVEASGSFNNQLAGGDDFLYDSVNVQCEQFPEVIADFNFEGFCVGEEIIFTDNSSSSVILWDWGFGEGGTSEEVNPLYAYDDPGTYTVSLRVDDGCFQDSSSAIVEIVALETLQADTLICEGESVFLAGALQTEPGIYVDTLPAMDTMSCKRILETELTVEQCNCYVQFPNVFTPDGDEINDTFGALTDCEDQISNYNLKIYSRWGELVFETENFAELWDGTFESEKALPDVYLFTVSYDFEMNGMMESRSERGDLTLIR